jgi:SAM-dependent methyltransferase
VSAINRTCTNGYSLVQNLSVSERIERVGLLGDTAARSYTAKLQRFHAFAEPELRSAIASLGLRSGMRVLDAGCGTGGALTWFHELTGHEGIVLGIDLAAAHISVARANAAPSVLIVQGDLLKPPLRSANFDLIWCVNTLNHFRDPDAAVAAMKLLSRRGGRLAIGQSSFVPDMYFAWDDRLERLTTEAVRQYYRDRYALEERDTAAARATVGLMKRAGLREIETRTFVIERTSPLASADREYLTELLLQNISGDRLRPYLSTTDHEELKRLCDPSREEFALLRADFHFLQTFTLVVATIH